MASSSCQHLHRKLFIRGDDTAVVDVFVLRRVLLVEGARLFHDRAMKARP